MPDFVMEALNKTNLFDAYESPPPYQKNDDIGWISSTKRPDTQQTRLAQMLDELRRGNLYRKMAYKPKTPSE